MMGNRKRRRKKDGLESKVAKFNHGDIKRDEHKKRYVPICNYIWHPGIIKNEAVCESRNCHHYFRAYIDRTRRPSDYDVRRGGEE